ncbi:agmatinase [Anoxynatronum sibiricum]|uniref:Agmatinase n=1 Tax=Anoxynatronum sibiricum TaxID=210623 RepID=A0ABU9W0T2_9CLOT
MKYPHPWGENATGEMAAADVLLMAVPFDGAVSNAKGAAEAPDRMRELSRILPPVTEEGDCFGELKVCDVGDVAVMLDWQRYYKAVEKKAGELIATGKPCVFLGGDHSVTIPLITAFASAYPDEKIGIIHFDSHPDIISEYDGHGWSHACTQRRAVELNNVDPEGLSFVGLRSFMEEELDFFDEHPEITLYKARDVYLQGTASVVEQLVERYQGYRRIYLTLDIDVLDPAYAPGTGTPEAGGLSSRELMEMVRALMTRLPIQVVDLVEVSPPLDHSNITSWAALKVIYEVFGVLFRRQLNSLKEG